MANNKKTYQGLRKKEEAEKLLDARFTPSKEERIPDVQIKRKVIILKHQIKTYIAQESFSTSKTFAAYLKKYMATAGRSQKELADDISVHRSRLTRILQGKEQIRLAIAYRLEHHSGGIIPALLWWQLVQREEEEQIIRDKVEREKESKYVKNIIC